MFPNVNNECTSEIFYPALWMDFDYKIRFSDPLEGILFCVLLSGSDKKQPENNVHSWARLNLRKDVALT